MNLHNVKIAFAIILVAAVVGITGCKSAPKAATEVAEGPPSYVGVEIDDARTWDPRVAPEGDDIESVTAFAVSLGAEGRHAEAADLLESKAKSVKSRRNELNIQLYLAAANEYLKAGDLAGFARSLDAADTLSDQYQRAARDQATRELYRLRERQRQASGAFSQNSNARRFLPLAGEGRAVGFARVGGEAS